MKKPNSIFKLSLVLGLGILLHGCQHATKQVDNGKPHDHSAMMTDLQLSKDSALDLSQSKTITPLIDSYLALKDALVMDDAESAVSAAKKLVQSSKNNEVRALQEASQSQVNELIIVIRGQAEQISKSELVGQRANLEAMSKVLIDLLVLTGTDRILYQQYCPMYNQGNGGIWLSISSQIQNPLFGSKMPKCGTVQQTISM